MDTRYDSKITGLDYKTFYKEFGQLIYALAATDGKVRKQEAEALREFVAKELSFIENSTDGSGMDKAFYVQFEFEEMAQKQYPAETVFMNFMEYLKANKDNINVELRQAIINAVKKVSGAFYNTNKQEQEMIEQLTNEISNF